MTSISCIDFFLFLLILWLIEFFFFWRKEKRSWTITIQRRCIYIEIFHRQHTQMIMKMMVKSEKCVFYSSFSSSMITIITTIRTDWRRKRKEKKKQENEKKQHKRSLTDWSIERDIQNNFHAPLFTIIHCPLNSNNSIIETFRWQLRCKQVLIGNILTGQYQNNNRRHIIKKNLFNRIILPDPIWRKKRNSMIHRYQTNFVLNKINFCSEFV